MNNTTGATIRIRKAYPPREHEFKPIVSGIRVVQYFVDNFASFGLFFYWLLYCVIFFFEPRLLVTPLISSKYFTLIFHIFRQFICPLNLFLKEIPFASFTNAINLKIERVLTGFLIVVLYSIYLLFFGRTQPLCFIIYIIINLNFSFTLIYHLI